MTDSLTIDTTVYPLKDDRSLSLRDLLDYFAQHGALRVSDLHLKVGYPPMYRHDGRLRRIKGPPLDQIGFPNLVCKTS